MDGLIAPLRLILKIPLTLILKITNKSRSDNNRTIHTRDIRNNAGPVKIDQSVNSTINVNPLIESDEKSRQSAAIDGIWNAFLELKNNQLTAVFLMDIAHPNNELDQLRKNRYFSAALTELNSEDITQYLEPVINAEKHKPYVTERLWDLLDAYTTLVIRPALLLHTDFTDKVPANTWWEDEIIKKTISGQNMPKGLEQLARSPECPLQECKKAIERNLSRSAANELGQ